MRIRCRTEEHITILQQMYLFSANTWLFGQTQYMPSTNGELFRMLPQWAGGVNGQVWNEMRLSLPLAVVLSKRYWRYTRSEISQHCDG